MREVPCSVVWAMPSRWTFSVPPIRYFVHRYAVGVGVDPFSGTSTIATYRNDLARGGKDAAEWCWELVAQEGVAADYVLFDPPYSPRQIAECYQEIGRKAGMKDTQSAVLYAAVREPLWRLLKPGGVALSFGWSSAGFGKTAEDVEMLIVRHGGAHNDTICMAQRKPLVGDAPLDLFEERAA